MGSSGQPHILAIIGSGETSPTMVTIHKDLAESARAAGEAPAVLLETPYGFQENASAVSAKAQNYFAESVGLTVQPVRGMRAPATDPGELQRGLALVRAARWLFAGPGSPSYALVQWRNTAVVDVLHARLSRGPGVTVFASAAACTLGVVALPVYEIYKAGADPEWLDGLDLLQALGLRVAVIPHYDNTEGGTYDTRYCYAGERRLRVLETQLPDDVAILGIDEHTALIFDLAAGTAQVRGRGAVTIRRRGVSSSLPAGSDVPLEQLRGLTTGAQSIAEQGADLPVDSDPDSGARPPTLPEATAGCLRSFDDAERRGDAAGMAAAVLELQRSTVTWATDTDADDSDRAHSVLGSLVVRLGDAAADGVRGPAALLAPAVEPLLALREQLRSDGQFPRADEIRDALGRTGIVVQDTPGGTRWQIPRDLD